MDSFKSWLVANLEVILIILTILFLAFSGLFAYNHYKQTSNDGYITMFGCLAIVVVAICAFCVFFIKNGFFSLVVLTLFIGLPILVAVFEQKNNSPETTVEETTVTQDQPSETTAMEIMLDGAVERIKWTWFLWAAIPAFLFGLICSIYANRNFEDVVSRRFLFRNSEVSVFEVQWKYTFNRFYAGFMTIFAFALEIILFLALKP